METMHQDVYLEKDFSSYITRGSDETIIIPVTELRTQISITLCTQCSDSIIYQSPENNGMTIPVRFEINTESRIHIINSSDDKLLHVSCCCHPKPSFYEDDYDSDSFDKPIPRNVFILDIYYSFAI